VGEHVRKLVILFIIIATLCGCSIKTMDTENYGEVIDKIINNDKLYTNVNSTGYSYYLPNGISLGNKTDFNEIFYDGETTYYLYVDVVGYYYNSAYDYSDDGENYYYKLIGTNDGQIKISLDGENYFVQFIYNYAKIELYTSKDNLEDVIINSSYILASLEYNDAVIKNIINSENSVLNEQKYDIFEKDVDNSQFLEAVNEYDKYKGSIDELLNDENIVVTDEEEENKDITEITE